MMEEQQARAMPKKKTTPQQIKPHAQDSVVEEISIENEQSEPENIQTMIEEIPLDDDTSPSGRLDSIRREMNPDSVDSEESSLEDRMSKFFQ